MAPTTSDTLPLSAPTQPLVPDLTIDNITEKVVQASSQSGDARLNYLMERLVTHVHDFARETRLSTSEWMAAIQFLTQTGQMCSPVRQVCAFSLSLLCCLVSVFSCLYQFPFFFSSSFCHDT